MKRMLDGWGYRCKLLFAVFKALLYTPEPADSGETAADNELAGVWQRDDAV